MELHSLEVEGGEDLRRVFTVAGANVNPPLDIEHIPRDACSLVLFFKQLPNGRACVVRWVVYNIPVRTHIDADSIPGTQAVNDLRRHGYRGPEPDKGNYAFELYALDTVLVLGGGKGADDVRRAMSGHVLDRARLRVSSDRKQDG